MQDWDTPGKYLELLTIWGSSKTRALNWIKERVFKLLSWKNQYLSMVGKEELIKSFIQAIPTYAMSIVLSPKSFSSSLNSAIAKFWLGDRCKDRECHWVGWKSLKKS